MRFRGKEKVVGMVDTNLSDVEIAVNCFINSEHKNVRRYRFCAEVLLLYLGISPLINCIYDLF